MNPLLSQLEDIEGLDQINFWPLAIGWWILIAFFVFMLSGIFAYYFQKRNKKHNWQWSILDQLSFMEIHLTEENAQATLVELSELIRRIAIHQYSRDECAGLVGDAWLCWLRNNDPLKFNWENEGRFLIEVPYAPSSSAIPLADILAVITAIKGWVK